MKGNYSYFNPGEEEVFSLWRGHPRIDCSYPTLRRYAQRGAKAIDGTIVKMEVCLTPSGVGTTMTAFRKFFARLNGVCV